VSIDDDHARFDRDQVDAHQGDTHPCIDDDSLIEYTVEYIDETRPACSPFDGHPASSLSGRA